LSFLQKKKVGYGNQVILQYMVENYMVQHHACNFILKFTVYASTNYELLYNIQ